MAGRGCGERVAGGVYATLDTDPGGSPLEDFMICPPIPVDPAALGMSARGVKLIERNGLWHVLDWVGENHYPNPTDDLEEIRRMGMSARLELASAEEYAKLTLGSRVLRVHPRAYITDPRVHWEQRRGNMKTLGYSWNLCPKHLAGHISFDPTEPPMCLGLLYEDIRHGVKPEDYHPDDYEERFVLRHMPSFIYRGYSVPETDEIIEYQPAIYASFPIQRLVVVRDPAGGTHEKKAAKIRRSNLFDPETGIVEE